MKQRVLAYDALRMAAMLAVIGIHAFMTARGITTPAASPGVSAFDDALHFAVPLLVFLSGVLVWGRPFKHKKGAYRRFMSRRLTRVGVPYLAWFAFYGALAYALPTAHVGWLQGVAAPPDSVGAFVLRLLSGNIWYHLYFIPMILTFAALTPLADYALRAKPWAPELLFVATLALKVFLFPTLSPWLRTTFGPDLWAWLTHLFVHLPHMVLGACFALHYQNIRRGAAPAPSPKNAALAALPLTLKRVVGGLRYPVILLVSVIVALWLEPLWKRMEKPLSRLAALSFGAYFVHPLFLVGLQALYPIPGSSPVTGVSPLWIHPAFIAAVWVVLTLASFATAALLAHFRPTRWLIGE